MYHDVVPKVAGSGGGPERFSVSVESFERMLDSIAEVGHMGCSLDTALHTPGQPRVAITFDDGRVGQFDHAIPALRARNMTATFFVTTDWVGTPGFMTWDQLRQMVEWGMSVQSHTRSHPHLSGLDRERLRGELADSKTELDRQLGQDTTQLALPGGDAPRRALRPLVHETGYRVVATSRWGQNAERVVHNARRSDWIRRCTAPRSLTPDVARRIISGDARLTAARYSREMILNGIRATLGADRYWRWRRRVLDLLAGEPS
jgi:peptidoglycan/xylan/chitin deacetylase (PgdA/CDA1 family)